MRHRIRLDVALADGLTEQQIDQMRTALEIYGRMLQGSIGAGSWLIHDKPVCSTRLRPAEGSRGCLLIDDESSTKIVLAVSPKQHSLFQALRAAARTLYSGKDLLKVCVEFDPATWRGNRVADVTAEYSDLKQICSGSRDKLINKRGTYGFEAVAREERRRSKSRGVRS